MLDVIDLTVAYGTIQAVRGISFQVLAGQIVSLVGANGAGKSTTLAAISGLVPPRGGRVLFNGEELTRLRSDQIVQRGVVQVAEGRAILGGLSVVENLELGGYHRRDRLALRGEMASMMERFPILGRRRHAPAGSLSGGEQQMLAIARSAGPAAPVSP
jgi:branched-chain amino acid transport system ATP-binding protein